MGDRRCYLTLPDLHRLRAWGTELGRTFNSEPYLVGSVLTRADYRDVDVRVPMDDDRVEALAEFADLLRLNLALSEWGRQFTGLDVDCQIQKRSEFQAEAGLRQPCTGYSGRLDHRDWPDDE
jgi:hypothetical protein